MKKITKINVYTTSRCPNCKQAKAFLQQKKVRFVEFNIETNQRAFKEFQKFNSRGVPVITIGEVRFNGFDAKKLEQALIEQDLLPNK